MTTNKDTNNKTEILKGLLGESKRFPKEGVLLSSGNGFIKYSDFIKTMNDYGLGKAANEPLTDQKKIEETLSIFLKAITVNYATNKKDIVNNTKKDRGEKYREIKTLLTQSKNQIKDLIKENLSDDQLDKINDSKIQDVFDLSGINFFQGDIADAELTVKQITEDSRENQVININLSTISHQLSELNDVKYKELENDEVLGRIIDEQVQAAISAEEVEKLAWFKYFNLLIKKDPVENKIFIKSIEENATTNEDNNSTIPQNKIFEIIETQIGEYQDGKGLFNPFKDGEFKTESGSKPDVLGYIDGKDGNPGKYTFMAANSAVDNHMEGTQMTRHPAVIAMAITNIKQRGELTPGTKEFGKKIIRVCDEELETGIDEVNAYMRFILNQDEKAKVEYEEYCNNNPKAKKKYLKDDYIKNFKKELDSLNIYSFQKFPDPLKPSKEEEKKYKDSNPKEILDTQLEKIKFTDNATADIKKGIAYSMTSAIMFEAQMINNDPKLRYVRPKRGSQKDKESYGDQIALSTNTPDVVDNASVGAMYSVLESFIRNVEIDDSIGDIGGLVSSDGEGIHLGSFVLSKMLNKKNGRLVRFAAATVLAQVAIDLRDKDPKYHQKTKKIVELIHAIPGINNHGNFYNFNLHDKNINKPLPGQENYNDGLDVIEDPNENNDDSIRDFKRAIKKGFPIKTILENEKIPEEIKNDLIKAIYNIKVISESENSFKILKSLVLMSENAPKDLIEIVKSETQGHDFLSKIEEVLKKAQPTIKISSKPSSKTSISWDTPP
jgi:hypothetical protein